MTDKMINGETDGTIADFVAQLNRLDVQLSVEGEPDATLETVRLRCSAPAGILTAELRQALADRKGELIAYLYWEEAEGRGQRAEGRRQRVEGRGQRVESGGQRVEGRKELFSPVTPSLHDPVAPTAYSPLSTPSHNFPLSFAQQRLWFLYQLAPDNPFYNVPTAIRLQGRLDRTALQRSIDEIVRRHATLRTTFTIVDGQPVQTIAPNSNVQLSVMDLLTVAVSDRERISQQLATAEAQRSFNLTTDPPLRVTLLQFDHNEAVLLLTLHHIVADGWSLGVLIRELGCCYTAFVEGRSPSLPSLPIQYTDFACWQRHWLQGEVLEKQLIYWRKQLQDLPVLHLPSDRPRPAVQSYRGATYPLHLSPTLTQALETLSQQSGTSLFMTLLAAFQTLLYRYTGQEDIAIGSPIANRHRSEVEELIGFFVNSVVIRSNLAGNPSFRELLEQVRQVALQAYEHQDLPFEKLVEELDPERDLSRNPLFQVAFALQNAPMQPLELPGLRLEPAPLPSSSARFDLEVHLWEPTHGLRSLWQSQEGLSGFIAYSTDLFDRDRMGRLIGHYQTLLEGIVANPDDRLSDLPLLPDTEYQQVVVEWNQPSLALLPQGETVAKTPLEQGQEIGFHHIFAAQVQSTLEAIALVTEQGALTYRELNQQADDLARRLKQMGVGRNSLVGVCVDRSADMIIGFLGILKAGGAYVPLDPNYPRDRLQFMLTDTQLAILLTQSWLVASLPPSPAKVICLDQPAPSAFSTPLIQEGRGNLTVTPDHLAYVIYTSGSTGTPKGVLLTHRGLCNVVETQRHLFQPSGNSRILQFSSLSFDASLFEFALALGAGGTLYIPPKSAQLPGMALLQFLEDNAITHALLTPSVLAVLPVAQLPALQVLITGGEACSSHVLDRWAVDRHFFNAYGPTEATIFATVAQLHPGDYPLTIGRPIHNTQVYILDPNLNPVPAGIPGELYIGGVGLAQGYLNRPALTAERFIDSPFKRECKPGNGDEWMSGRMDESPSPHPPISPSHLYKTGDRALYHPDGTIEFLGRIDHQIKIRGFRVELGEIEATLQQHPAIQDAVVTASADSSSASNEVQLIAYFSLDHHHLQQTRLPALQAQHLQYWQTLYDQTYHCEGQKAEGGRQKAEGGRQKAEGGRQKAEGGRQKAEVTISNAQFNITGWNSSYTGDPIPLEQMQEWVSDRVQQILALNPKRILEIGCGTGLLLFQLAPHCQQYVATDFSDVALETVQTQLNALNWPHVQLLHRMADDFSKIDRASFDVVILNSIVQYFPGQEYLMQVLEVAMQRVAAGGVLFVGDVRSLPLLPAFHAWVQFYQADDETERNQLQHQVNRSQFEEAELAIDPLFFYALGDRFSQIRQVQTRLARGRGQNEMTQFRYNVLLHIGQLQTSKSTAEQIDSGIPAADSDYHTLIYPERGSNTIQSHDWKLYPITIEKTRKNLIETAPAIVLITNVRNRRVTAAVKTVNWLRHQSTPKTVGRMRDALQNETELSIDPQDWWDLATELPYTVEITWSAQTQTGDYDVMLIRHGSSAIDFPISQSHDPQRLKQSWNQYTNVPLQSNVARQLMTELRQYLQQTLPDYMIPAAFVPLDTLPLTASGKVDRHALPRFSDALNNTAIHTSHLKDDCVTQTEATLLDIWKDLLRLNQVNLHDNFFELGGHSLLATQMTSRIRTAFGVELPLQNVFAAPTIAQLAPILETLRDTTSSPKIPPLVRLDRSAYRRQRSTLPQGSAQPSNLDCYTATSQDDRTAFNQPLTDARSPLVPLTLANTRERQQPPFFCVHPMFGVVFPYLELAHHLGSHRSFYGLQPLGLDGKAPPLNQMEAIAAYYIRAMQTIQPHGPYLLGGWSFGGLVAFEMAQQLTQAGESIGLLAILDTTAPCHKSSLYPSLKFLLKNALWSTLPFLLDYSALATNRWQSWNSWFSRWQWSAIGRLIPEESRLQLLNESAIKPMLRIVYANTQATHRYRAKPYSHQITLFRATEQPEAEQDSTLGWSALANDIQLHHVPGNHLSLLKQPHVQTLAQQLGQYL
jgi:amino acid adenylation domain-containing protein